MKLRRLTPDGIIKFKAYLTQLKAEPALTPPKHLLAEDGASETIKLDADIECKVLASRLDAAKYLDQVLSGANWFQIGRDAGLWAWLALLFFDQICPPGKTGARKPGEHARYVPLIDVSRRYYRHMLLGPVMMFRAHADKPDRLLALLSSPLDVATSETYRLFIENPTLISCKSVIDTATWLYFDVRRGRIRRGAGSKMAGGCRRLVEFLQQIDCTFDLPVLPKDQLIRLLPEEFKKFIPNQLELIA